MIGPVQGGRVDVQQDRMRAEQGEYGNRRPPSYIIETATARVGNADRALRAIRCRLVLDGFEFHPNRSTPIIARVRLCLDHGFDQ